MEAGFIGGEPGAHFFHATEGTHGDMAVRFTTPRAPPMLESQHLFRRFSDKGLDRILIAEPIAARDRVAGMFVQAVIRFYNCGGSPFGRDRVAAHRVDLRDHRYIALGIDLGHRNGRPQASAPTTYQQNIMSRDLHNRAHLLPWPSARGPYTVTP